MGDGCAAEQMGGGWQRADLRVGMGLCVRIIWARTGPLEVVAVKRRVARLALGVHVEPADGARLRLGVGVQRQHRAQLGGAVEVHRRRLHPRVVGVARVVDVAAVDGRAALEELGDERVEERAVLLLLALALPHLLHRAQHRRRHRVALLDHPARQRPLVRVLAQDGQQLHLARQRLAPRHDRVGRVVGAPLPQQPAPAQPGAAVRVERRAARVKVDGRAELHAVVVVHRVRRARVELEAQRLRRVRPAPAGRQLAAVGQHVRRSELGRLIVARLRLALPQEGLRRRLRRRRRCRLLRAALPAGLLDRRRIGDDGAVAGHVLRPHRVPRHQLVGHDEPTASVRSVRLGPGLDVTRVLRQGLRVVRGADPIQCCHHRLGGALRNNLLLQDIDCVGLPVRSLLKVDRHGEAARRRGGRRCAIRRRQGLG